MRKKIVILVVVSIALVIGLIKYNSLPRKSSESVNTFNGYGIALNNPDGSFHNSFVIKEQDNSNFDYSVKFTNNSGVNGSFILLVSINYKQIPFYTQERPELVDNYKFTLEAGKEKIIPIHFPLRKIGLKRNVLVISVLAGPDKHASELKAMTNFYGATTRYNLIISNRKDEKKEYTPEKVNTTFPSRGNFSGILLNNDNESISKINIPPTIINAKRNQKINLFLRAGGYSDTENYLAWITTGWKQTPIDGNKEYFYFKVPKGIVAYKKINFIAPKEKGKYDVCAFLAANPFKQLDDGFYQNIGIDTSYRFTLNVE